MIDTHAHLNFKEFDLDREKVIKRFFDAGGEKMINVGCDLASSEGSIELAKKHKNIFASIGIHPHDAEKLNEEALKKLEELIAQKKVVAVGEIGLDFFRDLSPREIQTEAFKAQLELAEKHKKPIIIHCREAYVDLLEILKSYKTSGWRGVTHCFLGSWLIAEELIKMGFNIGFTGAITYVKKPKIVKAPLLQDIDLAESLITDEVEPEIYKVIKNTPLDRIFIETDCPYLAPVPHRGERNEPAFVSHVAKKIAELKGVSVEKLEKATSENAKELFGI
ncbi:MAG: TatD family hydrolase [bacterium]|nr:TatD family hydrolase [bacterium]